MIKINLLPPTVRQARGAARVLALPWRQIGMGLAAVIVLYSLGLLAFNFFQNKTLARLVAEWEGLQPQRMAFEQRQAVLDTLQNRSSAIRSMKSKEAKWAPRLNLLSDALVRNLWFSHMVAMNLPKSETVGFLQKELKDFVTGNLPGFSEDGNLMGLPGTETLSSSPTNPSGGTPAPQPQKFILLLGGNALVEGKDPTAPVTRFLQKIKEHPEFSRWFTAVELKDIFHQQVGREDTSGYILLLYPTGS